MTRPWRLTRRQRVEMEAALLAIRRDVVALGRVYMPAAEMLCRVPTDALGERWALADRALLGPIVEVSPSREQRILRARVAIALRAALRADEDARCEEATDRALDRCPEDTWRGEHADLRGGAMEYADAMREWPALGPPTRDTGALASMADWSEAMGIDWRRMCTPDERERWQARNQPVMAMAYALWERAR